MKEQDIYQNASIPIYEIVESIYLTESTRTPDTASGSVGGVADDLGEPASMAESVTRHAQNPPADNFQFLTCGIDTLDLGLFVSWDSNWGRTKAFLAEKKEAAQGTNGLLDSTDIRREFLHQPGGKPPNYRFQLQFPEYRVFISISEKFGHSPNVYVTIMAETLWHVGISTILELLEFDIESFGGTIELIQPSRCDLCADFKVAQSPTLPFIQQHRVSRSHKNRPYLNGESLETFYCGSPSSPVQVRIYDKSKEIQKTNKLWFPAIWGIEDPQNIWRVEFQLRRSFLHQYRINTLDDLWQKIGAMWAYLTAEWFSLRIPDNEKAERRSIHPWWLAVQDCQKRFGDLKPAKRTFTSDRVEPIKRTLAHIIGRFVTIAAQSDINDKEQAIQHLSRLIHEKLDDRKFSEEFTKKSIKLGYRGKLGGTDNENC